MYGTNTLDLPKAHVWNKKSDTRMAASVLVSSLTHLLPISLTFSLCTPLPGSFVLLQTRIFRIPHFRTQTYCAPRENPEKFVHFPELNSSTKDRQICQKWLENLTMGSCEDNYAPDIFLQMNGASANNYSPPNLKPSNCCLQHVFVLLFIS